MSPGSLIYEIKNDFDTVSPMMQKRKSRPRSDLTKMIDTGFKCKTGSLFSVAQRKNGFYSVWRGCIAFSSLHNVSNYTFLQKWKVLWI